MKEKGSLDLLGPSTMPAVRAMAGMTRSYRRFGITNEGALRAPPHGIISHSRKRLGLRGSAFCVVTHNTGMQVCRNRPRWWLPRSLPSGSASFGKALLAFESQPPRGNWSPASVAHAWRCSWNGPSRRCTQRPSANSATILLTRLLKTACAEVERTAAAWRSPQLTQFLR